MTCPQNQNVIMLFATASYSWIGSSCSQSDSGTVPVSDFAAVYRHPATRPRHHVRDVSVGVTWLGHVRCHVRGLVAVVRNLIAVACPRLTLRWPVAMM